MTRTACRSLHALCAALVLGGCAQQLTEVMVVVDSDLSVPEELDAIRIDVTSPDGEFRRATAALTGDRASPLPRTLGIVHRGGPLAPLTVVATGVRGGTDVIQRRARLSFAPGRVVVLRLDLLRSCLDRTCASDQTCTANGCAGIDVDVTTLPDWSGSADPLDASADDAATTEDGGPGDACAPTEEVCNERDDDCDGFADEGFELGNDPAHCGECDRACPGDPANATSACVAAACALDCDPGWGDCGGALEDGCETLLSVPATCGACDVSCAAPTPLCAGDPLAGFTCAASCTEPTITCGGSCIEVSSSTEHCGECDRSCPALPNASPVCASGECGYACSEGFHDCNGVRDDGCESMLQTLTSCGACGMTCELANATESCASGTCAIVGCDAGHGDCDGVASNGCETSLATDVASCGECGRSCPIDPPNAASSCSDGGCVMTCNSGWADCNVTVGDGCEASLASADTCGGCGIRCEGATPVCASNGAGGYACESGCGAGETLCAGSCVDVQTSPSHCGACGSACADRANSSPTCSGGACGIACDPGYGDCDGMISNGCETSLSTLASCGACGAACELAHASESCPSQTCTLDACESGWSNCDGVASNGCEIALGTSTNCAACGNACPSSAPNATGSTCTSGACVLTCASGYADCDGVLSNGCETSLTTTSDCGACGTICARDNASETCSTGSCRIGACETGWGNCDGVDANGCESTLTTLSNCAACGTACELAHAGESCSTGACRITTCDSGWANCDSLQPNGCETSLTTLSDCAACGMTCDLANAAESCSTGTCALGTCDAGWGNCDLMSSTGCETNLLTTEAHCGACGNACSATQDCCGGSCCAGTCCGGSCCPSGRTCCAGVCCGLGQVCNAGSCAFG